MDNNGNVKLRIKLYMKQHKLLNDKIDKTFHPINESNVMIVDNVDEMIF